MGLLKLFSKPNATVHRLPTGSMTVDRNGHIVAMTISSAYPSEFLEEVAGRILRLFREARAAQITVTELNIHFASLQITAREMRGGALIFLAPRLSLSPRPNH